VTEGSRGPWLGEGWYLMSVRDLEIELARMRDPSRRDEVSNAVALSVEEALAYRNRGNLPDHLGRSLRLVLLVDGEELSVKRLRFESDYQSAPVWRREGSRSVNVVPLEKKAEVKTQRLAEVPWWEQPDVAALEQEWRDRGTVFGLPVPGDYRSFVFKTVVALKRAGRDVTVESILGSVARWLSPDGVEELRAAFERTGKEEAPGD
jgi:hypothetical protein